ncbi:esterase [Bordetella sp. H567]|nr:esterase [Bordetella sp. H567]
MSSAVKVVGVVAIVVVAVGALFRVTPWPGAMIIRAVFEKDSAKVKKALEAHTPGIPIAVAANERYKSGDGDALLDAYYPQSAQGPLPVVIWTHGGAWISGHKDDAAPYFKLIAAEGYTVISLGYSLAPGKKYATPLHQLNEAYAYIQQNADRLHADTSKIFLAGDSAGSQISSQMATLITSPSYASEVGITPNLKPVQLKGFVLWCGIYQMDKLANPDPTLPKIVGWGDDITVWAYSGTRDFADPVIKQMSPYYHVTKDFPPAFISGGNVDPLTDVQSKVLAQKLQSLGAAVDTLFFEPEHQPQLPHEYQSNLDNEDGKAALARMLQFLKAHAG